MLKIDEKTYNKMPDDIKKHFLLLPNKSREEVEALFPETKSGNLNVGHKRGDGTGNSFMGGGGTIQKNYGGDSGSASRFFYVAKASQEERNFGLYDFEKKQTTDGNIRSNQETARKFGANSALRKNIHPTVKPIELMRYLVRMITPPNGICLDPYLGSGTTAIACEMEKFNYIGIELDEQYVEIAKARVGAVKDYETHLDTKTVIKESIKEDMEKEKGIQTIFDFME